MSLASTSKAQLAFIEETVPGVTPGAGTPRYLRMTGEKLNYQIQSETSKEINASAQTSDRVHVGATADGGIDLELNYREYDSFFEALARSTFSTAFGTDGVSAMTVSILAAGTVTDDGIDGFAGLVAGQWFRIHTGNNAGVYRIQSLTDDAITVDPDTPLVVDEAAVATDISSARMSNGTAALRTFSIEKHFSDVTQFFVYKGMAASKMSLSLSTGSLLTGSIDFMGFNSVRGIVTALPGAPSASEAHGIMNAVTGVSRLFLDNAPIPNTFVKTATIDIDGALRGQTAIKNLGNVGIGQGTFKMTGTLEMYLADGAIYDDALANNTLSLEIVMHDVNNNGYAFIFDNIKLDVPAVQAGAMDSDVMLSVPFEAIAPNNVTDKMLHIDRFGVIGI